MSDPRISEPRPAAEGRLPASLPPGTGPGLEATGAHPGAGSKKAYRPPRLKVFGTLPGIRAEKGLGRLRPGRDAERREET